MNIACGTFVSFAEIDIRAKYRQYYQPPMKNIWAFELIVQANKYTIFTYRPIVR